MVVARASLSGACRAGSGKGDGVGRVGGRAAKSRVVQLARVMSTGSHCEHILAGVLRHEIPRAAAQRALHAEVPRAMHARSPHCKVTRSTAHAMVVIPGRLRELAMF